MAPRQIIIDTDPGQDDAVALMLALGNPAALDVLGVTAVAGNVRLDLTVANSLKLLELVGRGDIPVFAGAAAPLMVRLETAEYVHGETGLNGWEFSGPVRPPAAGVRAGLDRRHGDGRPEKSVTLCALGPLTNVALAIAKEPRVASRLTASS